MIFISIEQCITEDDLQNFKENNFTIDKTLSTKEEVPIMNGNLDNRQNGDKSIEFHEERLEPQKKPKTKKIKTEGTKKKDKKKITKPKKTKTLTQKKVTPQMNETPPISNLPHQQHQQHNNTKFKSILQGNTHNIAPNPMTSPTKQPIFMNNANMMATLQQRVHSYTFPTHMQQPMQVQTFPHGKYFIMCSYCSTKRWKTVDYSSTKSANSSTWLLLYKWIQTSLSTTHFLCTPSRV